MQGRPVTEADHSAALSTTRCVRLAFTYQTNIEIMGRTSNSSCCQMHSTAVPTSLYLRAAAHKHSPGAS